MVIIEERTVGPSLGKENIEKGFESVIIGFLAVLVFMALYYKAFGLIADIALTFNLVLLIAILSLLQATLTLPGIAGIVLTVGMAVDANVLIYERIREELRNGNTPQAAIYAGYQKAFGTIADANITTLIAAVILFSFGTGPIKGFAVTLSIGILTSMFTAIMGTRALVTSWAGARFGSLLTRGLNVGIDFTGGTVIELGYPQPVDLQPIRDTLAKAGYGDAIVQHFGSAKEVLVRLAPRDGQDKAEVSSQAGDAEVQVRRVDFVGPQVGEELREDGGLAVLYALIAILIYVSLRFEYRFSLGAVAALVHDVT